MQRMSADVDTLRLFVRGERDQAEAGRAADDLIDWSQRLPELFSPQEVAKYADFPLDTARAAAPAMLATATRLRDAVRTGDRAATGEQLSRTETSGCGACHRTGIGGARLGRL